MRRLIEGLDELAGLDVRVARCGVSGSGWPVARGRKLFSCLRSDRFRNLVGLVRRRLKGSRAAPAECCAKIF